MIPYLDLATQYSQIRSEVEPQILKILASGNYILGPEVDACEKELAQYVGVEKALVVSNGTIALQMALQALDVGPGDEVVVPSFSFFATAEVVSTLGAKPVFVDIDEKSYNIDINKMEAAITSRTKAIMPVSLFGQIPDMDEINSLAKKYKLTVIEDAAQSFGATYKGKKSCGVSDIGSTSFFPAKPLGCAGDGGALFTSNPDIAKKLESIRVHGQTKRYYHEYIGVNGRLDPLQCVVIRAKLRFHNDTIAKRQKIAKTYDQAFSALQGIVTPTISPQRESAYGQYTLMVENREQFVSRLMELGVPTSVHYPYGIHEQPIYKSMKVSLPVTEKVAKRVVSLPLYPDMPPAHIEQVIDAVKRSV